MSVINVNLGNFRTGSPVNLEQENISNQITSSNNVTFTISKTPKNGNVILTLNGQSLTPGAGKDYTINQKVITILNNDHVNINDELLVIYIT